MKKVLTLLLLAVLGNYASVAQADDSMPPEIYFSIGYEPIRISPKGLEAYNLNNVGAEVGLIFRTKEAPYTHWNINAALRYEGPWGNAAKDGCKVSTLGKDAHISLRSLGLVGGLGYSVPVSKSFSIEPNCGTWWRYNIQARLREKGETKEDYSLFDAGWRKFQIFAHGGIKLNYKDALWIGAEYNYNLIKLSKNINESYFNINIGFNITNIIRIGSANE